MTMPIYVNTEIKPSKCNYRGSGVIKVNNHVVSVFVCVFDIVLGSSLEFIISYSVGDSHNSAENENTNFHDDDGNKVQR